MRIRDILVRIRIRIRTSGYRIRLFFAFFAYYFLKLLLSHFSMIKSHKEVTNQQESRFFLLFCLMIEGSGKQVPIWISVPVIQKETYLSILCVCTDVGAGEHGREHCDRDPAGVRHLGQEALTLPHQVRLQSQTLPTGSNQRFIQSWISLFYSSLNSTDIYVTGGFFPHIRFGGFLLTITPRLNTTILRG